MKSTVRIKSQDHSTKYTCSNLFFASKSNSVANASLRPSLKLNHVEFYNDGLDAFLIMSSAYYDRTCLKSAVDFERKIYLCLSRSSYSCDARANLHETHLLAQFTTLSIKISSQIL